LSLQGRLWGKNRKEKVWLRCERKKDHSFCVSSWSLMIYQYTNTTGALMSILFHSKSGCSVQRSHIYPGVTHGLNLDLVGWTVGPLWLKMGVHISFAGTKPKPMGL